MSAIPEWARALRRPNTEVREINGRYYLYEVHCRYDRETKKIKPVYLGRLVEGVGFIPKVVPMDGDAASELESLRREVEALRRENESLRARLAE